MKEWRVAWKEEIISINKNKIWIQVDKPSNIKVISLKWVFKIKKDVDGTINKFKSRLCSQGISTRTCARTCAWCWAHSMKWARHIHLDQGINKNQVAKRWGSWFEFKTFQMEAWSLRGRMLEISFNITKKEVIKKESCP